MSSPRFTCLMQLYDCQILIEWLENENETLEAELWQKVCITIARNPELELLQQFLIETTLESIPKRLVTEKIIEMLCHDGSIRFDMALVAVCSIFRSMLVQKFTIKQPYDRPEAQPCFEM